MQFSELALWTGFSQDHDRDKLGAEAIIFGSDLSTCIGYGDLQTFLKDGGLSSRSLFG